MKSFWIALTLVIIVATALTINSIHVMKITYEMLEAVELLPDSAENINFSELDNQLSILKEIEKKWDENHIILDISISYHELLRVENEIGNTYEYLSGKDGAMYLAARKRLIHALKTVSTIESLSLENVL